MSVLAVNLNCIPLKSLISTNDVSTFSFNAILLSITKVPVGCSLVIVTSLIASSSLL